MTRQIVLATPKKKRIHRRLTMAMAASLLGVNPAHLSRVLNGHRESTDLKERYAALVKAAPVINYGGAAEPSEEAA